MSDAERQRYIDLTSLPAHPTTVDADEHADELWDGVRETVLTVELPTGRAVQASPSWAGYGYQPVDLLGRCVLDLVHPEDRAPLETYLERPDLACGGPTMPARMQCGDGSWLGAVLRVERARQADDRLLLSFLPMDEITATTLEREQRAADQLRLVDEMKHHLLEVVSHELRTPLTVVGGFAETLQRQDMTFAPARLRQIGASIARHAARLEAIVTDLVDLDTGTRTELVADRVPTDLAALAREALEAVDLGARLVRLELEPVVVPVDRDRVLRVLTCLLDNVRRHTPGDTGVHLRVAPDDGGALLVVGDDGPGLSPSVREQAFSPFAQGRLREAASPGLGLGLALVRRFTELHGGRCWYEVSDGGGARFNVHLPGEVRSSHPLDRLQDRLRSARQRETALARDLAEDPGLPPEAQRTIGAMLAAVRRELGMEVAYLSTFTATHQVVLACAGDGEPLGIVPGLRVPLEQAYCVRMVRGELRNVVPDTVLEPGLRSLAPERDGIRCYVGVPVHRPDGHLLGSLCCASGTARPGLREDDAAALRTVAGLLGDELSHHLAATADDRATAQQVRDLLATPDGLHVVFQPIVELSTGAVVGVEALSRFPDSGVRPPDVWFADAARVGLGGPLERAALLQALQGLRHLPDATYLAVNLSPATVDGDGLRLLLDGVPLDRVVLEITEHAAVEDYDRLESVLQPLRAAGARLAIDDVGAGFASLRHVLRMGPDIIKLDRSLVSQVAVDPAQQAVTVAFAQFAQRVGNCVVAEGIEDVETLHALLDAGVTHGQGWLFDRPAPLPLRTRRYPVG